MKNLKSTSELERQNHQNFSLQPSIDLETGMRIDRYQSALPRKFDFYSEGQVLFQGSTPANPSTQNKVGILYRVEGETKVLLTLLAGAELDLSLYSEIGNIMAAKMAHSLEKTQTIEWMISPPRILTEAETNRVTSSSAQGALLEYHYLSMGQTTRFQIIMTLAPQEGIGNA
jgi:hypothetical protein